MPAAQAHESRPAYLEIKETAPGQYTVLWRTPVLAGRRLPLLLSLPEGVTDLKPPVVQELNDSLIERRWIDAGPNGLAGQRIEIKGLQFTITDALVRFEFLDGRTLQTIVRPSQPWVEVAATQTRWQVMGTYVVEGIRHILFGADHLLFVLGLLLIVADRWMLVKTVTAFTVAHSITLAVATLRHRRCPGPAAERGSSRLSILFLGPEIVRVWRGQTSFTIRHPWVVAFAFGLLHGFGFATAMTSAGLPRQDLPLALLSFNVGVELGQLAFVALVLALERAFRVLQMNWPRWVQAAARLCGRLARCVLDDPAGRALDRGVAMRPRLRLRSAQALALLAAVLGPGRARACPAGRGGRAADAACCTRSRAWTMCWRWWPSACGARNWACRRSGCCRWRFRWSWRWAACSGFWACRSRGSKSALPHRPSCWAPPSPSSCGRRWSSPRWWWGASRSSTGMRMAPNCRQGQSALLYSLGFVIATGCLHALGIGIGTVHSRPWGRQLLRVAGAAVSAGGAFFMGRALA